MNGIATPFKLCDIFINNRCALSIVKLGNIWQLLKMFGGIKKKKYGMGRVPGR